MNLVREPQAFLLACAALLPSVAACTDDEPIVDTVAANLAPSCGNGIDDAGELCPGDAVAVLATPALRSIAVADLNGDGRLDVAAVSSSRTYVRLQTATGWGLTFGWSIVGADYRDIAPGDFDADGDVDLVVADRANDRIAVHWNPGTGALAAPGLLAMGDGPTEVLAAPLDAVPGSDVITLDRNAGTATVRLGAIGGPMSYFVGAAPDIALTRCNADPWYDLIYSSGTDAMHQILARPGSNVAAFGVPIATPVPLPPVVGDPVANPLAIVGNADLDGDGFGDAVVTADGSRVAPATSNGNCTFTPQPLSNTWAYAFEPDLRDVDGDGEIDLVAPHASSAVSAIFGDGAGGFPTGAAVLLTELYAGVPPTVTDIAPADVDGDGDLDYLVATTAGIDLWTGVP